MKKSTILLFCLAAIISRAQVQALQWCKQQNGALASATGLAASAATDASGNVFTMGTFAGNIDFDPGPGTFTMATSPTSGGNSCYISKLDAAGNFAWAKQFIDSVNYTLFFPSSLATDASGNVYATGFFANGPVDFNPGPGVYTLTAVGMYDSFVVKLDASGNFVWAKQFQSSSANCLNQITSIAVGSGGGVYVSGGFAGAPGDYVDFDPGAAVYTLTPNGSQNTFIVKLDASGNFVWAEQFANTGTVSMTAPNYNGSTDLALDVNDNIYLGGYFTGSTDFDPSSTTASTLSPISTTAAPLGIMDMYMCKLSSSGSFMWAKQCGGSAGLALLRSITVDPSGNVYSCGNLLGGAVNFDPASTNFMLTSVSASNPDMFIAKWTTSGNFSWAEQISPASTNLIYARDMASDANSNIYILGRFNGTIDFDPGSSTANLTASGGAVLNSMFISKLNSSGGYVWAKQIGGAGLNVQPEAICVNAMNVYTAGEFPIYGTNPHLAIDVDPDAGVFIDSTHTFTDLFIHKLAVCVPVNTTPVANLNACSNSNVLLTAMGTSTINWYSSATSTSILATGSNYTVPPLAPGTYTFFAESFSCAASVSVTRTAVSFTVNPSPTVSAVAGNMQICVGQSVSLTASGANTYSWMQGGTGSVSAVSPTVSTNYTVTGTNTFNCTDTSVVLVIVNPLPTVAVLASNTLVCAGQSVSLTASGAATYSWTQGGTASVSVINPTASAIYTLTGVSAFNCFGTGVVSVSVNPLPALVIATTNTAICVGQSVSLTATGASTYSWSSGDTGTLTVVNPTTTTIYTVTGISANGCQTAKTLTQTVSECTGLNTIEGDVSGILIYPNPFDARFMISSSGAVISFSIYNATGQLIDASNAMLIEGVGMEVDLSREANGIYFLKIMNENRSVRTFKVVKAQ